MAEDRGSPPGQRDGSGDPTAGLSSTGGSNGGGGGKYLALGLQFVLSILLFLYLGKWLDKRFGTAPWLLIIGVFAGAGASFYSMYRQLMGDLRRDEAARGERHGGPPAGNAR